MPQPLKDFIESGEKEFDDVCKTLNIQDFLDLDFDAKLKSFLSQRTTKAYELGKQEGKTPLENKLEQLAEKYGTDIDPVELAREKGKQDTLAMVMREIEKLSTVDIKDQSGQIVVEQLISKGTLKQKLSGNGE